jgi:hypothetical protein
MARRTDALESLQLQVSTWSQSAWQLRRGSSLGSQCDEKGGGGGQERPRHGPSAWIDGCLTGAFLDIAIKGRQPAKSKRRA